MKKTNKLFHLKYTLLCTISCLIYQSCITHKHKSAKKNYLEGLYCTEKTPSDTGGFYREYLEFKKDGSVISMTSSLKCDTVDKLINKNYAEIGKYTIIKNDSIIFTFINNRVNKNEYKAVYRGRIINNKKLNFTSTIQYKEGKPYQLIPTYYLYCL